MGADGCEVETAGAAESLNTAGISTIMDVGKKVEGASRMLRGSSLLDDDEADELCEEDDPWENDRRLRLCSRLCWYCTDAESAAEAILVAAM